MRTTMSSTVWRVCSGALVANRLEMVVPVSRFASLSRLRTTEFRPPIGVAPSARSGVGVSSLGVLFRSETR